MKEEVIDQTPKRMYFSPLVIYANLVSAELKFETFTPIEIKKNGVVELTNRDLYLINEINTTERVPAQYGPLDLRLVLSSAIYYLFPGIFGENRYLRNLWIESTTLHWSFWVHQISLASVSHRIL